MSDNERPASLRLSLSASKALLHVRKRIAAGFVGEVRLIVVPGGGVRELRWLDEAGPGPGIREGEQP